MSDRAEFVAIDGEGITFDNRQAYVLLAASTGQAIQRCNREGLSTMQCLDFLLNLKADNPDAIFVGFGFNYDVNMILKDFSRAALEELWEEGTVIVNSNDRVFRLNWIPGKFFEVVNAGFRIKVYDAWGFFQSSFVHALDDWKIGSEHERDLVAERKEERHGFTAQAIREIRRYCLLECKQLVELMERLTESLERAEHDGINLRPNAWYGSGAVASKLLRVTVKKDHAHDDAWPDEVRDAIMRAYFGGRVEIFMQGELRGVTSYDIRSAYPRAMMELPSLAGGRWDWTNRYDGRHRFAIWDCIWKIRPTSVLAPFPVRDDHRCIFYPLEGRGFYHASEVRIAKQIFDDEIIVVGGYVFEPATFERPFSFVHGVYNQRKAAKELEDPCEFVYKLALNSLYGKLAQGRGFGGSLPAFQSYAWAGAITAWTRARVLDVISLAPHRAAFSATDAIAFLGDVELETSSELGGFERSEWDEMFIAQAGVYYAVGKEDKIIEKSRGFFVRDLDFDQLREVWKTDGVWGQWEHSSRRFYGIGSALGRKDFSIWRQWKDEPRTLGFFAARKFYARNVVQGYQPVALERLLPPSDAGVDFSRPYVPKDGHLDLKFEPDWDYIAGIEQPRILT